MQCMKASMGGGEVRYKLWVGHTKVGYVKTSIVI